jgi:DNA-binding NarL/FixJ family response regulator
MTTSLALEAAPSTPVADPLSVSVIAEDSITARRIGSVLSAGGMLVLDGRGHGDVRAAAPSPDVVILACDVSRTESLSELRSLRRQVGDAGIVVVGLGGRSGNVREALNVGADGFLTEAELEASLPAVVHAVALGHVSVPRSLRRCVARPAFSHRERQVLALVVQGLQNRQIAARLFLAESTVKSHLASSFTKLGVRSRKEAAALLLDPDEGLHALVLGDLIFDPRPS